MTTLARVPTSPSADRTRDLVGIGIGPFNLSLAALLSHVEGLDCAFHDGKTSFAWHPGLKFPGSILQTSFLKDLVTPVLPTSPYSFVNYLVEKKRFYDFMAGRFSGVSRAEFSDYLGWAAHRLETAHWGHEAREVDFADGAFRIRFSNGASAKARNLSVGTGMAPLTPAWAECHLGADCFHATDYLYRKPSVSGRRIAVVGGGQTGAEVVLDLLSNPAEEPAQVAWISNLPRFSPLEEGGFVDQVFTPNYLAAYRSLPQDGQQAEVSSQKLASDGLTPATVDALYAEIYRRKHLDGRKDSVALLPGRHVSALERGPSGFTLAAEGIASHGHESFAADVVILATGARAVFPAFLEPLRRLIDLDDQDRPHLEADYRMRWDGPASNRIFGLNMGLSSHGVIDPQMSMMAWRSAVIANALLGEERFDVGSGDDFVDWPRGEPLAPAAVQAMRSAG